MKIVFRVDASLQIGTGHVMRCLTLGTALKEKGAKVEFICRKHKGHLIDFIQAKGFKVHELAIQENGLEMSKYSSFDTKNILNHAHWLGATQHQDAEACEVILKKLSPDWLIVDHYGIDETWQIKLKNYCKKLMVIDDLGDRKQICDLLLDQNYGSNIDKYRDLVPEHCNVLTGTNYTLLRPEFSQWREHSLNRRLKSNLKNILISLGGVDPDNFTGQVLQSLKKSHLPKDILVIVIMGLTAPHLKKVQQQAQTLPYKTKIKANVANMAELMANADLAIGAAGSTTWERCCLGLPSIQIVIAENQKSSAESLVKIDAIKLINKIDQLPELVKSAESWMQAVGQTASLMCDGLGASRVINMMSQDV
jgi:UDP-2,4-diacetamido-2,4,6-trideoxy-beta-L-altropyranose hydrolase